MRDDKQHEWYEISVSLAAKGIVLIPTSGKNTIKDFNWGTDATLNIDEIDNYPWEQATCCAVVTGKSKLTVVDIDEMSQEAPLTELIPGFQETLIVRSVSGRGKHHYFHATNDQGPVVGLPFPGVDIRSGTSLAFTSDPLAILDGLDKIIPWPMKEVYRKTPVGETLDHDWLKLIRQGERNNTLTALVGAFLARNPRADIHDTSMYLQQVNHQNVTPPLQISAVNNIVHSIFNKNKQSPGQEEKELSNRPLRDLLKPLTPQDLIDREPPGWVIKDVLPKRGVSMLYGQSGVGKSFLALDMAVSLALGRKWRGQTVQQTKTVYLVLEGGGYFKQRLEAVYKKYGISSLDLAGMIRFYEPPIYEITTNKDRAAEFGQILLEDGFEGCQIIVDTYAASQDGLDENSNSQAQQAVNVLKTIGDGVNGGVLIVHHEGLVQGRPRGATALTAAMDAIIRMSTHKDKDRVAKVNMFKLKDGDKTKFKCLCQLSSTPLGYFDEEMEEVTSLVIDDYVDSEPTKINKKLSDTQQNMLDEITEMIKQNGVKETEFSPPYLELKTLFSQINPGEKPFNTKDKIVRLIKYGYLFELPIGEDVRIYLNNPADFFAAP